MALEGFVALAPDYLSPLGGTPDDEEKARSMFSELDPAQTVANGVATVEFLKGHELGTGKVGAVGFCWGGGTVNTLATRHARSRQPASPITARSPRTPRRSPRSRRRCFSNMPGRTNASMPASTPTRPRSKPPARTSPSISMRARSTPSTTTRPPRAITRKQPTSPGAGRLPSSRRSWPEAASASGSGSINARPAASGPA